MITSDYKCRLKIPGARPSTVRGGFTLIEMLVVIGVIGILAAMVVALGPLASRNKIDKRAKAELQQLITAIENYKVKKGFYPPSNPTDETKPPLYYELKGTRKDPTTGGYQTLDGASTIADGQIMGAYGVGGFVNSTTAANSTDPDSVAAEDFHTGLKALQTSGAGMTNIVYLGIPHPGPDTTPNEKAFTRWRYNSLDAPAPISRRPKRNKEGYDLWIELKVGTKIKTYGNWKE